MRYNAPLILLTRFWFWQKRVTALTTFMFFLVQIALSSAIVGAEKSAMSAMSRETKVKRDILLASAWIMIVNVWRVGVAKMRLVC